jgi:dTDP-4-amino-4,6-dideoxygalactose transaminase
MNLVNSSIPCANPHRQYLEQKQEIDQAVYKVMNSENYILGPEVECFEGEFAQYIGTKYCIGVNSGTDALTLALRALGVGAGDEVIAPSHTAVATISAITSSGAIPVFVDVEYNSYTINPDLVLNAITNKTKAIIAVHIYGHPCDMDSLQEVAAKNGIFIVEDCAQAHGALWKGKKVGGIGAIGCFSFYPTKNLGAIGDGGAITTNDKLIADKILQLRQYGWNSDKKSQIQSSVSRLDEIQAAILRIKLTKLDMFNSKRQKIARHYLEHLADSELSMPTSKMDVNHVFHLFVARTNRRDELIFALNRLNIYPGIHYPAPVHLHPAFKSIPHNGLPVTESLAKSIVSIPMFPELTEAELSRVCKGVLSV